MHKREHNIENFHESHLDELDVYLSVYAGVRTVGHRHIIRRTILAAQNVHNYTIYFVSLRSIDLLLFRLTSAYTPYSFVPTLALFIWISPTVVSNTKLFVYLSEQYNHLYYLICSMCDCVDKRFFFFCCCYCSMNKQSTAYTQLAFWMREHFDFSVLLPLMIDLLFQIRFFVDFVSHHFVDCCLITVNFSKALRDLHNPRIKLLCD